MSACLSARNDPSYFVVPFLCFLSFYENVAACLFRSLIVRARAALRIFSSLSKAHSERKHRELAPSGKDPVKNENLKCEILVFTKWRRWLL